LFACKGRRERIIIRLECKNKLEDSISSVDLISLIKESIVIEWRVVWDSYGQATMMYSTEWREKM
jgi:hypothetical protein